MGFAAVLAVDYRSAAGGAKERAAAAARGSPLLPRLPLDLVEDFIVIYLTPKPCAVLFLARRARAHWLHLLPRR